jgi:plasmid stability protein
MMRMRTTLTIDDDIMKRLRQKAATDDRPLREVVNEVLRCGLAAHRPEESGYVFRLTTIGGRLLPGVDLTDRDKLFDLLDRRD